MNGDVYVWIFIIATLTLLFFVAGYILLRNPNQGLPQSGTSESADVDPSGNGPFVEPLPPVGFMYHCSTDADCSIGLECDLFRSECRVPLLGRCNIRSDCVTGLYCSGVCLDPIETPPNLITKQIQDPCPCASSDYQCTSDSVFSDGNLKICVLKNGVTCTSGDQCASGICDITTTPPTCVIGFSNGEACSNDGQCISRNCSLGFCQTLGEVTGTSGASCNNFAGCNPGLVCSSQGICAVASSGLLSTCGSAGLTCPGAQNCYFVPSINTDGNYPPPSSENGFDFCQSQTSGGCICLYNTNVNTAVPAPNTPSLNGLCISGYNNQSGSCLAPLDQPCNNALNCASGSCSGPPKLYRFVPDTLEFGCYPNTGVYDVSSILYEPVGSSLPGPVLSITGYTFYNIPKERDAQGELLCDTGSPGIDVLFVRTSEGVYTLQDSVWKQILQASITDGRGNVLTLLDISAVSLSRTTSAVLVGYRVTDRFGDIIGDAVFTYSSLSNELFPYNETDGSVDYPGIQYTLNGQPISFDTLSITTGPSAPENFADLNVLLVQTTGGTSAYFKLYSSNLYSLVTQLLVGESISRIKLGYGLHTRVGVPVSYPLITYVSSLDGIYRQQRFTASLDPAINTSGYTSIVYPSGLYGAPVESSLVYSYTYSNSDPILKEVVNGAMITSIGSSGTSNLYYISNGTMTALPVYVDSRNLLYMTSSNLYIFSPSSCS